jgi:hypothetical protein
MEPLSSTTRMRRVLPGAAFSAGAEPICCHWATSHASCSVSWPSSSPDEADDEAGGGGAK